MTGFYFRATFYSVLLVLRAVGGCIIASLLHCYIATLLHCTMNSVLMVPLQWEDASKFDSQQALLHLAFLFRNSAAGAGHFTLFSFVHFQTGCKVHNCSLLGG